MADNTQPNQDVLSSAPPPSASGSGLPAETPLPPRRVDVKAEVPSTLGVKPTDFTPAGYVGQALVNDKGVIVRGQYSEDEAYGALVSEFQSPAERRAFLNSLAAVGVYGNSRPSSTGFSTRDLGAVKQAMLYANANGVTLGVAARLMAVDPQIQKQIAAGGAGTRIRTTPRDDLRAVFRQATGQVLGRQLSDAEIDKFIRSYNQAEVAEARGGAAAPSVQTAALQAAEAAAPDEAAAMGALQLTQLMENALKELG